MSIEEKKRMSDFYNTELQVVLTLFQNLSSRDAAAARAAQGSDSTMPALALSPDGKLVKPATERGSSSRANRAIVNLPHLSRRSMTHAASSGDLASIDATHMSSHAKVEQHSDMVQQQQFSQLDSTELSNAQPLRRQYSLPHLPLSASSENLTQLTGRRALGLSALHQPFASPQSASSSVSAASALGSATSPAPSFASAAFGSPAAPNRSGQQHMFSEELMRSSSLPIQSADGSPALAVSPTSGGDGEDSDEDDLANEAQEAERRQQQMALMGEVSKVLSEQPASPRMNSPVAAMTNQQSTSYSSRSQHQPNSMMHNNNVMQSNNSSTQSAFQFTPNAASGGLSHATSGSGVTQSPRHARPQQQQFAQSAASDSPTSRRSQQSTASPSLAAAAAAAPIQLLKSSSTLVRPASGTPKSASATATKSTSTLSNLATLLGLRNKS